MQPPKPVVFAMGANHFGQCAPDSNDELIRTPRPLRFGADQDTYATDVNGANWSQVICRVEGVGASGSSAPAHALAGYGASFQEDVTNDAPKTAYGRLPCDLKPRRYIGAEQYVALLDEDGSLWLFESPHDDDDRDAIVEMKLNKVTGRRWTDADMDGQGRVVAINSEYKVRCNVCARSETRSTKSARRLQQTAQPSSFLRCCLFSPCAVKMLLQTRSTIFGWFLRSRKRRYRLSHPSAQAWLISSCSRVLRSLVRLSAPLLIPCNRQHTLSGL